MKRVGGGAIIATGCCGYAAHIRSADAGAVLPEPFEQADLNAALSGLLSGELAGPGARALAYYPPVVAAPGMDDDDEGAYANVTSNIWNECTQVRVHVLVQLMY